MRVPLGLLVFIKKEKKLFLCGLGAHFFPGLEPMRGILMASCALLHYGRVARTQRSLPTKSNESLLGLAHAQWVSKSRVQPGICRLTSCRSSLGQILLGQLPISGSLQLLRPLRGIPNQ